MITDERYKQLMKQVGMPNSASLLTALKQVENETMQGMKRQIDEMTIVLRSAYQFCQREDCDGDMLHPTLALKISKVLKQ